MKQTCLEYIYQKKKKQKNQIFHIFYATFAKIFIN